MNSNSEAHLANVAISPRVEFSLKVVILLPYLFESEGNAHLWLQLSQSGEEGDRLELVILLTTKV